MSRGRLRASRVAVFVAALSVPLGSARAAPAAEPAERLAAHEFSEAQRAFEAGDFRRAGEGFEAAYRLKPHHDVLWNAARSWERAGDDLRAVNLLERYLREAPADAPDRAEATAALAKVNKVVGRVEIHVAGVIDVRLDGEPFVAPARYVAPGEHEATARTGTTVVRKVISVGRGEVVSVTLTPPPAPDEVAPQHASSGLSPWFVAAGAVVVTTGAVLTIISGLDTLTKRDAFLADRSQDRLDSGNASQTRTNVLLAATAGAAVLTTVAAVFFVDWKGSRARVAFGTSTPQARAAPEWRLGVAPFFAGFRGQLP